MKLSKIIETVNEGFTVKFSKKERLFFQIQKRETIELVSFDRYGKRTVSNIEDVIYKVGSFVKFDNKGLNLLDLTKKEIKKIKEYDLYNKKYTITTFKRPLRKSLGAKPINDKLEEYFKSKDISYQAEFKPYVRGNKSIADYISIQEEGIITYEVKSDVDSFVRLEKQLKDYKKYSNKIYIVLHHKKENLFRKNHSDLLKIAGLIVYEDELALKEPAPLIKHKKTSWNLLIFQEKKDIFSEIKGRSKIQDKRKCFLKSIDKDDQEEIILDILGNRFDKRNKKDYTPGRCSFSIECYQENITKYIENE